MVLGLSKIIVQVQYKVNQLMIRWSGNLGRKGKSEKLSFQMGTERNDVIWWHNIFREWIPKSRDCNWKSTSVRMNINLGDRQQVKTRWTELFGIWSYIKYGKYIWRFSRRKSLIGNGAECETDVRLSMEVVMRFQKCDRMG